MVNIKSSPIMLTQEDEPKSKIVYNENIRDYEIIYLLNREEQRWFGSIKGLTHSHPRATIIKVTKLKKR